MELHSDIAYSAPTVICKCQIKTVRGFHSRFLIKLEAKITLNMHLCRYTEMHTEVYQHF